MAAEFSDIQFRQLTQLFFVGLAGANQKVEEILRKFYADEGIKPEGSYFFYEYLLHQPFPLNDHLEAKDSLEERKKQFWLFAPFLLRLGARTSIGLDLKATQSAAAKNDGQPRFKLMPKKDLLSNQHLIHLPESIWLEKLLDEWTSWVGRCCEQKKSWESEIKLDKVAGHPSLHCHSCQIDKTEDYWFYAFSVKYTAKFATEKFIKDWKIAFDDGRGQEKRISELSRLIEHGYRLGFVHDLKGDESLPVLAVPLGTKKHFLGELLCFVPKAGKEQLEKLASLLVSYVVNEYVPTLLILHEYFYEKHVTFLNGKPQPLTLTAKIHGLTPSDPINYCLPWAIDSGPPSQPHRNPSGVIEDGLIDYWAGIRGDGLKENLVFQNYLVSSTPMVRLLCDLIQSARSLKPGGHSLPSVLVVGSAGSGKDTIPELIKAFSPAFRDAEVTKLNMAALKPDAMVVPLLSGVRLTDEPARWPFISWRKKDKFSFQGIFGQVVSKSDEKAQILVLDELNSMHIDMQGILLRFLENSETVPMGRLPAQNRRTDVRCLVIGMMNEDPDELSMEEALEFLGRSEYLGRLLKDVLYEQYIRMRRLRPDVKYRLKRGGYFKLPSLEERRDDIPVLFYLFLLKELKDGELANFNVVFDSGFVEELLSRHYSWPGNVRQVQTLVKKTIEIAKAKGESRLDHGQKLLFLFSEDFHEAFEKTSPRKHERPA